VRTLFENKCTIGESFQAMKKSAAQKWVFRNAISMT
jgi:hypothetical protein